MNNGKDTLTNHPNSYLIEINNLDRHLTRLMINARQPSDALRIALNKLKRASPDLDYTRARVAGVYPNKRKQVVIRTSLK